MEACTTCGQADNRPYRNRVQGVVEEGCIDAFHNGAMHLDAWHNQPGAERIRKQVADRSKIVNWRTIQ